MISTSFVGARNQTGGSNQDSVGVIGCQLGLHWWHRTIYGKFRGHRQEVKGIAGVASAGAPPGVSMEGDSPCHDH
jgi:hypothetical protein